MDTRHTSEQLLGRTDELLRATSALILQAHCATDCTRACLVQTSLHIERSLECLRASDDLVALAIAGSPESWQPGIPCG